MVRVSRQAAEPGSTPDALRNTSKNLDAYIRQWQLLLAAGQREGLELHQSTEAYLLLMGANLDDTQMEHVMTQLETAQRAAEAAAAAAGQPPPDDVISVQQVESMLRTLAHARQMRSLGSSTRYQRVPALTSLAQDDSGATVSEPAWEGGEEDAEWDEEDDGEDDDDPVAFAALQTLETLVGDEGNEYSIALAALTGRFQKSKKGGKGGKKGTLGKGPGAPASGSSALANATPKSKAKASRKCKFGANCEDMRKNIP